MTEWIRLSPSELFLLWCAMDLGEPPLVLDLPRPGRTHEQRARHAAAASEAMLARRLGTVHEPAPALAATLRRHARAGTTLDLRAYGPDGTRHGLGALEGPDAAVAIRAGEAIHLATVTSGRLATTLLGTLAPLPAGPGLPANVAAEDYTAACRAGEVTGVPGFARVLRAAGLREPEAATVTRAVATRAGGGQLGVTGHGHRAPAPVTWVDTPAGRYAVRRHGEWVTVTPADGPRLAAMASELVGVGARPPGRPG